MLYQKVIGDFQCLIILPLIRDQEETAEMDSWLDVQKQNRTLQILRSAAEGKYGVLAVIWWATLIRTEMDYSHAQFYCSVTTSST